MTRYQTMKGWVLSNPLYVLPLEVLFGHECYIFHIFLKNTPVSVICYFVVKIITPFIVDLHCINVTCTQIHETYTLMM